MKQKLVFVPLHAVHLIKVNVEVLLEFQTGRRCRHFLLRNGGTKACCHLSWREIIHVGGGARRDDGVVVGLPVGASRGGETRFYLLHHFYF